MAFSLDLKGLASKTPSDDPSGGAAPSSPNGDPSNSPTRPKPGLSDTLAGEAASFVSDLRPYLPSELVGGSVPYVPGMEEEAVWNAASQACSTEKVHYVYSVEGNRVWYLACPSAVLASSPDSWCPLAAALPGNSEFWDKETVYLYEQEGLACAMRWDPETGRMQIFLGASRTILPRIQSMDANFVTINPQVATVIPWHNRQLMTEKLARATARMLMISGIITSLVILAVMATQYIMANFIDRKLVDVRAASDKASEDLMMNAYSASQNDVSKHLVRVQQLLDDLSKIDGTLVRYEVLQGGRVEWEALVPAAYSTGIMSVRGQAQPGIEKDGRIRLKGSQ